MLTPDDRDRVQRCLDLLQQAQEMIELAGQALCPVPGFAEEWSNLRVPYETIKEHWHVVNLRLDALQREPAK
jgi:hypothetical protein